MTAHSSVRPYLVMISFVSLRVMSEVASLGTWAQLGC
jgi:hypothetical protein